MAPLEFQAGHILYQSIIHLEPGMMCTAHYAIIPAQKKYMKIHFFFVYAGLPKGHPFVLMKVNPHFAQDILVSEATLGSEYGRDV